MGIVFIVPGEQEGAATQRGGVRTVEAASPFGSVRQAVRVGARRAGEVVRVEAEPDQDLVVLQIAGGPELVLHPENVRDLLRAQAGAARGGGALDAEVAVPAQLRWQGLGQAAPASRGVLSSVLLSTFKVVSRRAAPLVATQVVQQVDAQVVPGVHTLKPETLQGLGEATLQAQVQPARDGAPLLVLLHGTFSSTHGTFEKLWEKYPDQVQRLFKHYDGRVLALEHATLGLSPIENARDLARALPQGAVLHLLTHSRGGLVAEVLARACAQAAMGEIERECFGTEGRDAQALADLMRLARDKRLRVERLVRVACPARGTLLASRRLDAYLSVIRWLLEKAGLVVTPALVDFLGEVARQRLNADAIPGLAAQVPDSPLVQWLHRVEAPIPGALRVVAGDLEGDSVFSWLKTLVSDAYYWTDNDLVVQTRSMYGGAPRAENAAFVLAQGGEVSHFAYFGNERTARAITDALVLTAPAGFLPIGPLSWAGQSSSGVRGLRRAADTPQPDKPAVVLLPGIVGSNLKVGDKRIWLSWRLLGGLRRLEWRDGQPDGVDPDGVLEHTYGELIDFLGRTHEVIPFDFDWRRPIEDEAQRLGMKVQAALDARQATGKPVRLLAHSMGGLVARVMQMKCPQVWTDLMAHPDARVLMLGTPNGGSWAPMQVISGDDTFGNALTAFGAPLQDHAARQMMAGFPGLLQMQCGLVDGNGDPDAMLAREDGWRSLARDDVDRADRWNAWHHDGLQLNLMRWGVPPQSVLDAAVALRRQLDQQRREVLPGYAERIVMVLGQAKRTPAGWNMADGGLEYLDAVDAGDGRVLDRDARLPGVRAWRAKTEHGSLPSLRSAHAAYQELLETGSTQGLVPVPEAAAATDLRSRVRVPGQPGGDAKLVPSRPSREGGPVPRIDAVDPLAPPLPAQRDTVARDSGPLRIHVVNGDLGFVRQPLLIGHYVSLGLTGSEKAVDRLLGGTLGRAIRTGHYPQQVGSQQIFENTRPCPEPWQLPQPPTVVVVGLGPEGKLQPSELRRSVRSGILAWALRQAEKRDAPARLELAATLLGSGGVGIGAGQAALLVAQAVREANERLRQGSAGDAGARPLPQVGTLVFVELYLDRATEAWRELTLQTQAQAGGVQDWAVEPRIERGNGAMERPLDAGYRGADYDLIIATTEEDDIGNSAITYRLDSRRARSEIQAKKAQGRLLRRLVADGSGGSGGNVGRTLFQLLVPPELEPFLAGGTATQIELDAGAAAIPWELLDAPAEREPGLGVVEDEQCQPWALRVKLLRKLRLDEFRPQVNDAGREAAVLVIGEPSCPEGYPRLRGARLEARGVLARLQSSPGLGLVRDLIAEEDESVPGPGATQIIDTLLERDWRIVHIAGHGEEPLFSDGRCGPRRLLNPRGVVLSDDIFLGPREIASMRVVPELVFVNCCFSGVTQAEDVMRGAHPPSLKDSYGRPAFAANVAQELIRIGVRCVVVTGWAVDDAVAETFADAFYETLLLGQRFIDAVGAARMAAWKKDQGGSTWGAYQCYGDPDWRLRRRGIDAQAAPPAENEGAAIASAPALVLVLRTLATDMAYRQEAREGGLRRLQRLEQECAAQWGSMGTVAEAFGDAYAALGRNAQAVGWYQQALQAGDGGASLRSSEQLYNLMAREAWEQVARLQEEARALERQLADPDVQEARAALELRLDDVRSRTGNAAKEGIETIAEALKGLERLVALQPTVERENLCGSACKRLAQARELAGQEHAAKAGEAVDRMKAHYARARKLAERQSGAPMFYPAMNLLAARIAAGDASAELEALADEVLNLAHTDHARRPDFWNAVAPIEVTAWRALMQGALAGKLPALLEDFRDLYQRVPNPTYWRSVNDQMRFLVRSRPGLKGQGTDDDAGQSLLNALEKLAYPMSDANQ